MTFFTIAVVDLFLALALCAGNDSRKRRWHA